MLINQVISQIKTLQCENEVLSFLDANHGAFFRFIPELFKTFAVCKKALRYSGNTLVHIDLKKFDPTEIKALCILAVENAKSIESLLQHIPSEYIDEQVQKCIEQKLLNTTSFNLKHVPEYMKTAELCDCAVEKLARNILLVPDQLQSQNMWFRAIKIDPFLIRALPLPWMNQAICVTATKLDPRSVYFIPKEFQNEIVCEQAKSCWMLIHPEKRSLMYPNEQFSMKNFSFQ